MASTKGTAANYLDLAEKIKEFLTTGLGDGNWRVLRENNHAVEYDAPGLSGKEHIYLSIEPVADAAKDHYYFALRGSIAFIEGNPIYGQPSVVTAYTPLINAPMNYWISANGQRAIVVVRVASVYMLMYLGKFLPYATPSQYPYPVIVSGMTLTKNYRYSSNELSHIMRPLYSCGYLYTPNNISLIIKTYNSREFTMPSTAYRNFEKPVNNDNPLLIPAVMINNTIKDTFGELDGLFWVSGFGVKSEDILIDNGKKYLVFQNAYRVDFNNFCAMEWQDV